MNANHGARLIVTYYPPNMGRPLELCMDIDPCTAEAYDPLERDRELYSMPIISMAYTPRDRERAQRQLKDRAQLTEYLSQKIAAMLAEAITKQDPQNGYDPKET